MNKINGVISDLMQLFQLSSEVRLNALNSLNSIDKKLLYIPKFSTVTYGKQSLSYLGPKLWNDTFKTGVILVSDIQKKNISMSKIKTIHNFKNALKDIISIFTHRNDSTISNYY